MTPFSSFTTMQLASFGFLFIGASILAVARSLGWIGALDDDGDDGGDSGD